MQFLEGGGTTGPNGRTARSGEGDDDEQTGSGRGSLMSRYRGNTAPDQAPAPREGGDPPTPSVPGQDSPWRESSTWSSTRPATPAPGSRTEGAATPAPAAPSSTSSSPSSPAASSAPAASPPAAPAAAAPAAPAAPVTAAPSRPAATPARTPEPAPAVTVTRGTTPGSTPAPAATTGLLAADRTAEFKGRWRELQGDFVDDPQQAVRGAGDLAREVLDALAATIADPAKVESWSEGDGNTEALRQALRQYRALVDKLLEI